MKLNAGSGISNGRYSFKGEVTSTTSVPVLVENVGGIVAVLVKPGTSARVEFTLSSVAAIQAGTASWIAWPHGDATEIVADGVTSKVTALRLASVGTSSWEITV